MNRTQTNFWLDSAILLLFLGLTFTGLLMTFAIPHGMGRDVQLWGLSRHGWGDIHFWFATAFLVAIAVHFILHWTWIKCTAMGKMVKRPMLVTLLVTVVLMTGVFVAAMASAPSGDARSEGEYLHERRGGGDGAGMGMGWRRGE